MGPTTNAPINPPLRMVADRHVLEKGLPGPRCQKVDVSNPIPRRNRQNLTRVPIVEHFMIIPLSEHGDAGIEASHVGIQQVVAVVPAKLTQGLGHLGLLFGHPVFPNSAIGQPQFRHQGIVRINGVPAVDKKLRILSQHGLVGAQATATLVDAIALAASIPGPDKMNGRVTGFAGVCAGRHQRTDLPVTADALPILEADAVEDPPARREIPQ